MTQPGEHICAVVLAAGESRRMGKHKLVLPWGNTTVIGQVVSVLHDAGVGQIIVVTGAAHDLIKHVLEGSDAQIIQNQPSADGEMLVSLQIGLSKAENHIQAALVVLGDQPQIQPEVVQAVMHNHADTHAKLVVPSFEMRRGHPWLVARPLWPEIVTLQKLFTLRDFLIAHANSIQYVNVDTPSILKDLDTPLDYQRERPV